MKKLEILSSKIRKPDQIDRLLLYWRFKEEKIVFTNGCFDVMHQGHVQYMASASDLGTKLVLGLNTDASVKRLKGESRPINNEYARAFVLAAFSFVDLVVFFDEDTPLKLIEKVQPDVLVKGGDYEPENIVGYQTVIDKGGLVTTIPFVEGFSSTSIIDKAGLV